MLTQRTVIIAGAAAAVVAAAWVASRGVQDTARAAGGAAVNAIDGVISGGIEAIGEAVGIPRTDAEKGRAALAAGDYWTASFLLPAPEFIAGAWRRLTGG